ncbi:amino acid adenylation domain-containing protein [Corticibacter populi]|uniref:Amino acid adenylation domain-containing protein n=1 Tax=Corticibacter populi TaxID=1550736 RepID=A0A3M6QYZ3_9BURK|nr:non-ribosomal peptide synthetase [Corticibacter populi]RMX07849.1 amino acid adenylation domain-containing protein [Corticibacter populi]RZS35082.1 enterobactin synthetase component F [Corticibacter populi]
MNAPVAATDLQACRWPLTEAQSGLWYAQRLAPQNPCFNTGHALWLQGALDVAAFTAAANRAAAEAQALRLGLRESSQGIVEQFLDDARTPWLQVIDVSAQPQPAQAAREAMRADMATPLDPQRDALALQRLYRLGDEQYVWYQRAHHLLNDGYGMALWESRVVELYNAAAQEGTASGGAGLPLGSLAAVMDEAHTYATSERRAKDAAYWQALFARPIEVAGLAASQSGKAISAPQCLRVRTALPPAWRQALLAFASRIDIPWPDVLTALTALYCQRMAGAEQTVVGIPFMGRLGSASARVPAMVMNVLPLPVAARPDQPLSDFLQEMARAQLRARRHGRYRSEQLRRDLGLLGGNRRLYGALINVQPFYQPLHLSGLEARLEILGTGPIDDITIGFRGNATEALELEIEANPGLYDLPTVQEHLERLQAFILAAFEAGTASGMPLASPTEASRYLFDVNATAHAVPSTTLVALIEAQMRRSPAAPALEFDGQILSHGELEQQSRALAQALQQRGVGKDVLVAVALPRSLELVIALVAVLRAGGAYLPLDLQHPPERLARVVRLAKPLCALVRPEDAAQLPLELPRLSTTDWPAAPDGSAVLPGAPSPHDLAYVIYTSGSTGEPKGVMIEHQSIVNRLEWMRQHYGFSAADRILQKTPATFDVSVWEFFLPLLAGATLVVAPPEAHRDPAWLARIIRQQRISTCHFVPSMLAAFLAEPGVRGLQMRRIFTSGEELPAELRDLLHATLHSELHNLYGPTEAAVDVSYWPAGPHDHSRPVPIGHPVWNTRLYVLDAQMRPQPPGVAGDLYLGGVQLARGYLGRDDLTRAAFLPDPHLPGERIYRTGDLARWRRDGALEYIGRSDHQVKLRGLRIELGEIEAAIQTSGMTIQASVIVREDRAGDKKLVAYVQPRRGEAFDAAALRQHIAASVPDYMVPSAIVAMAHWPVTSNGKLDRKALPAPQFASAAGRPLHTATEQRLAALFADVLELNVAGIDADSDFFSLGGDSLSAVQLLAAVQQEWQRNPGLGALFASPSVGALAALIDDEKVRFDSGLAPLIELAHAPTGNAAPLFVIHPAGGICWGYRHLARAISRPHEQNFMPPGATPRSVFGLQSPALDPGQPLPASIDELAAQYANRALEIQPEGPIHLLGWSVGGIIAQAIAVELQRRGVPVGLVAMLDAYPAEVWRAEPEPTPLQALRALLAIAGHDPEGHPELDTQAKVIAFLRAGDTALGNLPEEALSGVIRVVTDTNRLIRQHQQRRYHGTLTHVRAGRDHTSKPQLQANLWAPYADALVALEVPFLHSQLTGAEATVQIAPLLRF